MSLTILLITLIYQLVSSEQRTLGKIAIDYRQMEELQNLLKQLEVQINKEQKIHKYSDKPKNKGIIAGNDVLKLLLQREDSNKDRSEEGVLNRDDRDCKFGRCGCSGTRCGGYRTDSSSDEIVNLLDSLEKTIDKDMGHGHTRCGRGRCGKEINDNLRCGGGRCGGNKDRLDDRDDNLDLKDSPNIQTDIKQQFGRFGKTYKLNNQLDAIVLDGSKVNDAIKELNKHCTYANCKLIDYNSKQRTTSDVSKEKDSINAVILDLTHLPDSTNLAKDLNNALVKTIKSDNPQKEYLGPVDLDKYYPNYKRTSMNDVVDYLKDRSEHRETVKYLSGRQKQLVENVKHLLLKSGIGLNDKQSMKEIEKMLFGKHSPTKNFAHGERNPNIYEPKRLYNKIGKPKKEVNLRAQKRLLPLTLKQRNKLQNKPVHLWRRNSSSNYGLPFDFQVQGLGQVVP